MTAPGGDYAKKMWIPESAILHLKAMGLVQQMQSWDRKECRLNCNAAIPRGHQEECLVQALPADKKKIALERRFSCADAPSTRIEERPPEVRATPLTDGGVTALAIASEERGKPMMPPQSQAGTSGVTSCVRIFTDVVSAANWFHEHDDVVWPRIEASNPRSRSASIFALGLSMRQINRPERGG